jgi:hypothetical protein
MADDHMTKLSEKQAALLMRIAMVRYVVTFEHYMGRFHPNETIMVTDTKPDDDAPEWDNRSFRAVTARALQDKGLIRFVHDEMPGTSTLKPTRAGIEWAKAELEKKRQS